MTFGDQVALGTTLLSAVTMGLGIYARSLRRQVRELRRRADAAEARALTAEQTAERRDRNAWEFFSIIQGIERERNTWKDAYFASCAGASAAQAWLFRELSRLQTHAARLAKKTGDAIPAIDPALAPFLEDQGKTTSTSRAPGIQHALEARRAQLAELAQEEKA